jgi:hypothetical protein
MVEFAPQQIGASSDFGTHLAERWTSDNGRFGATPAESGVGAELPQCADFVEKVGRLDLVSVDTQ